MLTVKLDVRNEFDFWVFVIERGMLIVGCLPYLEFFGSLT